MSTRLLESPRMDEETRGSVDRFVDKILDSIIPVQGGTLVLFNLRASGGREQKYRLTVPGQIKDARAVIMQELKIFQMSNPGRRIEVA